MLLFESSPLITVWQLLLGLLTFVLLVGGAIVVLLVKKKDTTASVQIQRAEASEALLKTRDQELSDCNKKCNKCSEELEDTTTELRAQMGLNVAELMAYWETRREEMAEKANLKRELRILQIRLGDIKE